MSRNSGNDNIPLEVRLAMAELMFLELHAKVSLDALGISGVAQISTLAIALETEIATVTKTGGADFLPEGHIHFVEYPDGWVAERRPETYTGIFSAEALGASIRASAGTVSRRNLRSKYTPALDKLLAGDTIAFSEETDLKNFRVFCWRKGITLQTDADNLTATFAGRSEKQASAEVSFTVVSESSSESSSATQDIKDLL